MRETRLLALLATLAMAVGGGCSGDASVETVRGAQTASTTSTLPPTIPTPTFPPLPPGVTVGGDNILNVHSQVLPFAPGQTSWTSTSSLVAVTVRTDKIAPRAGEPVAFEVVLSSATQACCRAELRPGGDASFVTDGGLGCLPVEAAANRSVTFRWVHVYPQSGRYTLSVVGRAGLCSEPAATGGVAGTIEVA